MEWGAVLNHMFYDNNVLELSAKITESSVSITRITYRDAAHPSTPDLWYNIVRKSRGWKRGISGTTLYANPAEALETQDLWHNIVRKSRGH